MILQPGFKPLWSRCRFLYAVEHYTFDELDGFTIELRQCVRALRGSAMTLRKQFDAMVAVLEEVRREMYPLEALEQAGEEHPALQRVCLLALPAIGGARRARPVSRAERPRRRAMAAPGPWYVQVARPLRDEHRASKGTEGEGVQTP